MYKGINNVQHREIISYPRYFSRPRFLKIPSPISSPSSLSIQHHIKKDVKFFLLWQHKDSIAA